MDKIKVERIAYSKVLTVYPDIYYEIFGFIDEKQIPDYIYLAFCNSNYVGFLSAYTHKTDEVYIQYAGFTKENRGYRSVWMFREIIKEIHKDYNNIVCRIQNINIQALKVAMNAGFLIMGIRCLSNSIVFVELIKSKESR